MKFRKQHSTIINSVHPGNVIDFLFQEAVIGPDDLRTLQGFGDAQRQCRQLLALLHASENPQAFVKLYAAIEKEPYLKWLIESIDNFSDQSVTNLLQQQRYTSEPTGECVSTFFNCLTSAAVPHQCNSKLPHQCPKLAHQKLYLTFVVFHFFKFLNVKLFFTTSTQTTLLIDAFLLTSLLEFLYGIV